MTNAPQPDTPAPARPKMFTPYAGAHRAVTDYEAGEVLPASEGARRLRVRRGSGLSVILPSGESKHLEGDGTSVYDLPAAVAANLIASGLAVDVGAEDDAALVQTLAAAQRGGRLARALSAVRRLVPGF